MNDRGIAFMPVFIMGAIGFFTIGLVGLIGGVIVGLLVSILNTLVKILDILNGKGQFKDEN